MSLTSALFLFTMAAALGLALFRHPLFGLYAYVAVFYLDPPSRWWGAGLPTNRWSLLAAACTLLGTLRLGIRPAGSPWYKTTPGVVLIVLTVWLWIQSAWALDEVRHQQAAVLFTKYLFLYYIVYTLVDTPRKATWFLLSHVLGAFYLGWLAFNADMVGNRLDGVGGPGINEANALGMHLAVVAIMGGMLLLVLRGWRQYLCIAAMPFILNGIVLAGSRSSFLAILVGGLVVWYMKPKSTTRLFYGFASLGVVLFLLLAHDIFWNRMETITVAANDETRRDGSADTRVKLFSAQLQMAANYPLGTGSKGTAVLSPNYLDKRYLSFSDGGFARSSHSSFMTAWVEHGIPGAVMYLTLYVWILRTARALKRKLTDSAQLEASMQAAAVCGGLVVVLVAGIFVDYFQIEVQVWLLALLSSLAYLRVPVASRRSTQSAQAVPGTSSVINRSLSHRERYHAGIKQSR